MNSKELKEALLETAKESYKLGLVAGTSGNVSVYDDERDAMIITPSSIPYETMTLEDLVVLKLDGTIVEGHNQPSSEWRMHAQIFKERQDIKCVLHTHSPYATGFAVCRESIPVILIEMVPFIGGDVPVAKFGMPGTDSVGIEALKVLKDRKACLLSNHGTLAIGETIDKAFISSIYLEDAAKIYHIAKNAGDVKVLSEKEIDAMRNS
ncbi:MULTISPECIES: class II aldolase/adducin family protein [Clostridium]|uniref:Class II aldolase/adducin family protein n=1 Tax=Clostridium brassicae TaxID=2999072 RepID=A0ABT4DDG4_9CLOT|nr:MULTISPECIES: class II aldolase/adducin family protein [Clostridium]MCY6959256.1 class II aldolase/adducin family protein [Clostridium brassicae]WMJ79788.1 class II aldolase/adducin family protein [Clostridium sp. MB40-C1]